MTQPVPKPTPPLRDKTYRDWIDSLPCGICRDTLTVTHHHVKTKGSGGGDDSCVPLCFKHHVGDEGVHRGREWFAKMFPQIDLAAYAVSLRVYYERMRGLR